ncbi:hypothetical protein [Pseudokineococcus sp. 1T1Z-3]|uniref:hypothetical protein n=1 Tax=Pseudokineococcus sp. 1T1Z-3 TaxID=3132745 RepID=UPI00403FBA8F
MRDAVLAAPGVVSLHAGALGEVGTYLPGRRVNGVRLTGEEVEVHVVAALWTPVTHTSAAVITAVAGLPDHVGVAGLPVHVVVEDVADDEQARRDAQPALPAGDRS